jgi:hypothetical protein
MQPPKHVQVGVIVTFSFFFSSSSSSQIRRLYIDASFRMAVFSRFRKSKKSDY